MAAKEHGYSKQAHFWRLLLFTPFILIMGACGGSDEIQGSTASYFASRGDRLTPSLRLFHASADSSVLHIRIDNEELLYTRSAADAPFTAEVKVKVRVLGPEEELLLRDSTFIEDQGKGSGGSSYGRLSLVWPKEDQEGRVEVLVKDMERGRSFRDRLPFDRKGVNAPQNFLPVDPESGKPFFRSHFSGFEHIELRYERGGPEQLFARGYKREFPLPPPPFAEGGFRAFDYAADSLFTIPKDTAHTYEVPVPREGFYHLQVDSAKGRKGFTLFHFREGYPRVNKVEALLSPIRYLTSKEEFAELKRKKDVKAAVDSFWVARGGSKERAKKLIEAYYQRVEAANRYFTSHVQGWKTDRGLVHVIFGKPVKIERIPKGEKWIYGEGNEVTTLTFQFERVKNPFTKEDMTLERSSRYKRVWYRAVESWRNGRVYSH